MSKPCDVIYGFYNLVDKDTTLLTASDEDAFYPVENIQDARSTKVFRSTTASASVVFDFITTEEVDLICVRPNIRTGFGFNGSLTIEANATDNWGAPAFSTTLTPNTEFNFGYLNLASAESYRFWRITGTGTSYLELSNIFFGQKIQAGKNISFNWTYNNTDNSKLTKNKWGDVFIDSYGSLQNINGEIKLLTSTEREAINEHFNFVGKTKPFVVIMDNQELFSTDSEEFAGFFRFKARPGFTNLAFGYFNTKIQLIEVA
jgi:hypothetical protein